MIEDFRNVYTTFNSNSQKFNQYALTVKKVEHDIRRYILNLVNPEEYEITRNHRRMLVSLLSKANFGSAILNYNGDQERFVAFSKLDSNEDWSSILPNVHTLLVDWDIAEKKENPIFNTTSIDELGNVDTENAFNRNVCTESKIIESIASILENDRGINGTLDLYTDRRPCQSCETVISTFSNHYPLINIKTFYAK